MATNTAPLRWEQAHDGSPHAYAYEGDRLYGQIAHYDVVAGGAAGWVGFIRGGRVTGRCANPDIARAAVERTRAAR